MQVVTMLLGVKVGEAIKRFLDLRGLKQEEAALAIETNPGNFSRMLRGLQDIPLSKLQRIAAYLHVPLSEILAYAENPDPQRTNWMSLYDKCPPEQVEAVKNLLDPPAEYKKKVS